MGWFGLAAALLVAPACNRGGEGEKGDKIAKPEPVKEVRVEVATAVQHKFSGRLPITGELRPVQEVTIKSRVGGNVVELRVDEGDPVKKGQLIARIDGGNQKAQFRSNSAAVAVADAQLLRAQAEVERLKRDVARVEMLQSKGAGDQKTLDDARSALKLGEVTVQSAQAQIDQARAVRDLARNAVGETVYKAPISGVVSRRGVSLHEYLDTLKNRDIVTIVDNSAMELVAAVAADLATGIVRGSPVEFQVNAPMPKTLAGEVITVNPTVDPRTRTVRLRVRIPNPDGILKGGMYATGYVTVGGERTGVGVPSRALHQEAVAAAAGAGDEADEGGEGEKQSVVWRVSAGAAEKLVVHTGVQDGDLYEILNGLKVGDQVVVSSPANLKPGLAVLAQRAEGVPEEKAPEKSDGK